MVSRITPRWMRALGWRFDRTCGARAELNSIRRHRSYLSWWRHQRPSRFALWGRSSHGYIPQRPSVRPRGGIGVVAAPSSSTNALMPGRSRKYVAVSVPAMAAISSISPRTSEAKRPVGTSHAARAGSCIRCPRAALRGEPDAEFEVEVTAERDARERPPHPPLERLQLCEWRPRHRQERDVMVGQVDDGSVEAVRDRGTGRTPGHCSRART